MLQKAREPWLAVAEALCHVVEHFDALHTFSKGSSFCAISSA